jgi:hypothetical protein
LLARPTWTGSILEGLVVVEADPEPRDVAALRRRDPTSTRGAGSRRWIRTTLCPLASSVPRAILRTTVPRRVACRACDSTRNSTRGECRRAAAPGDGDPVADMRPRKATADGDAGAVRACDEHRPAGLLLRDHDAGKASRPRLRRQRHHEPHGKQHRRHDQHP